LYEEKGNLVGAAWARAMLEDLETRDLSPG
jgi:hypothetical protein